MYYVGAHGSRNSILSFGQDGNQPPIHILPEELAAIIKLDSDYCGQPVVLWGCENGKDPENKMSSFDCYAQKVADALGANSIVIASEGYCEFRSYINQLEFNGKIRKNRSFEVDPRVQYIFQGKKHEE